MYYAYALIDAPPQHHAVHFRGQRAAALMTLDIAGMSPPAFGLFCADMKIGNRGALPPMTVELADLPPPAARTDGWLLISKGNGDLASSTATPLALNDDETRSKVGEAIRFADRDGAKDRHGDLWGYVVWLRDGEEEDAYEARKRKALIELTIAELHASGRVAMVPQDAAVEVLSASPGDGSAS
jgi:hypothetical protein